MSERLERLAAFLASAAKEQPGGITGAEFRGALASPPSELFDPEGTFVMVGDDFGGLTNEVSGPDAAQAWGDWLETFESYRLETKEIVDTGSAVLFLMLVQGRTRTGGVDVEHEAGGVFRFRGERVVRVELYLDWKSARAAAGLDA